MTVWFEVESALEEIVDQYEKVNHVISIFQDDKTRLIGLRKAGPQSGVSIELGSGPGNFSRMIEPYLEGPLVCLDFSDKMLLFGRKRNQSLNLHYVLGVFEALPFRENTACFMAAAYAIRDSLDKRKTLSEIHQTLKSEGKLLLIDIGKPDNTLIREFMRLYMQYIVPILGGLVAGYGHRNPWSILIKTFKLLPTNGELTDIMESIFRCVTIEERAMGAMIIGLAQKRGQTPK